MTCPHQTSRGELGSKAVAGCQLINDALGWPKGAMFSLRTCELCQASTPTPVAPVVGSDSVVTLQFKQLLKIPLISSKQGDEFTRTYGATRNQVAMRCDLFGVPRAQPRPPPTLAQRREQEARKLIKRAARDANQEAQRQFKADPCIHFKLPAKFIETDGCDCGLLYDCDIFPGGCVVSFNDHRGKYRSCLKCPKRESARPQITHLGGTSTPVPGPLNAVILVTTSPIMRPKGPEGVVKGWRDTLPKTLNSIEAAGWTRDDVTIFAEPESHVPSDWRVVQRDRRHEPWHNMREGLAQLLGETSARYFFLVEDDTVLAKDLRRLLDARGWPSERCGLLRVFRMKSRKRSEGVWVSTDSQCEPKQPNGYQKVFHGTTLFGSNAVVLSRQFVEAMLKDPGAARGEYNRTTYVYSPDVFMGLMANRWGFEEWCCNPSLAQTDTVNVESSIGNTQLGSDLMMADVWEPDASRLMPLTPLPKQTTIFLISYNRLTYLKQFAEQCSRLPGADIRIVDNRSTWEPLTDWLRESPYKVYYRIDNLGKRAPWELGLVQQATERYVVSDPDLDLTGIPLDMLDVLRSGLDEFPWANAAGLSLEIEDLPESYLKDKVLAWEDKFWRNPLSPRWFKALVDTTFAMRRRGEKPSWGNAPSVRANRPYTARHLPWYVTMEEWTDEDRYYHAHCTALGSGSLTRKHVLPLLQGV